MTDKPQAGSRHEFGKGYVTRVDDSPWLQVLGGVAFDLVHPRPEQVDFGTIATVLARTPRFGGHTDGGTLSVAQHCEQGARAILRDTGRADWAAAFLIHDAHEAYIGDLPTPVQNALAAVAALIDGDTNSGDIVKRAIEALKRRLDIAIYLAAGIPDVSVEMWGVVKSYDRRMCVTEHDARMPLAPRLPWHSFGPIKPVAMVDTYPWSEGCVRSLYMAACYEMLPAFRDGRLARKEYGADLWRKNSS